MALEDLLKKACEKGLTHLTLWPVQSHDGKTTYWIAKGTPSSAYGYVQSEDKDPIKALTTVLENLPAAKKRKVTGAVREPTRAAETNELGESRLVDEPKEKPAKPAKKGDFKQWF
jgi:hypothetical protein